MSQQKVIIFKAVVDDSIKLKDLRCRLVTENPNSFGDTKITECAKSLSEYTKWINEYNNSAGAIFLLETKGELIGMGAIKRDQDSGITTAYMGSLGVLKKYQGRGYGKMLITVRLKYAKEQGYSKIKTITTKANNKALSILKSYGFEITGEGVYKGIPEYYLELKV